MSSSQPGRPVLGYATPPPSRRLRFAQHLDGISILFRDSAVPALLSAVTASSAVGLEGCLLVVLAPVFLMASLLWTLRAGVTWEALMFCAIGAGVIRTVVLSLGWARRAAHVAVRSGAICYPSPRAARTIGANSPGSVNPSSRMTRPGGCRSRLAGCST